MGGRTALTIILTSILILVFGLTAAAQASQPCNGTVSSITVNADGGVLYSSGYPQDYPNSDSCGWILSAISSSEVVQIETLDIDLELHNRSTCEDFIAAYDGNSEQSPLLKKWCGHEKAVIQSTGRSLFLKFVSSPTVSRKGFAIAYQQITPIDYSCEAGTMKTLSVGPTPVLYHFQHDNNNTNVCQWRFEPQSSQRLVLTGVEFSGLLPCDEGYLALHDGADTSAPEAFRWCSFLGKKKPFSAFYPSGPALLVLHRNEKEHYSFRMVLKAQTRPAQEICDSSQTPVFETEEHEVPVLIAFPYATTAGGGSCPVRFDSSDSLEAVRVDILTENNQAASCNSSAVSVYKGDSTNSSSALEAECWQNTRPMFLDNVQVTVAPAPGQRAVLLVVSLGYRCGGWISHELTFYSGSPRKFKIPENTGDGFPNYCVMRYEFEAEKGNHPLVHFEGRLNWPGSSDIITVYDGESIHDPVIYVLNETDFFQDKWVVGSKQKMIVEVSTDATQGRGYVELKAQSSPVGQAADLCIRRKIDLNATSTPQNISSVNYPGFFPSDNVCHYLISTKTKGDVVHLEVLEADFGQSCDSQLNIYNGDSRSDDKLGMVCHGNPGYATKFESLDSDMLVAFVSGKFNYGDGWKVRYYSAPPTPPIDDEPEDDHTAAIVGGVLGAIIVILLIIIIWCAVTRRRSDSVAI